MSILDVWRAHRCRGTVIVERRVLPATTTAGLEAILYPADIPGLYDVEVGERRFYDLTAGQLRQLASQENWQVRPAPPGVLMGPGA